MKFLCFGEILFDIFGEERKIGGAPFNFAAHAARAGAQTYLMSAVGEDELGEIALQSVERHGVGTEYISRSSSFCTGACRVSLDENKIPHYELLSPVAYDDISASEGIFQERFDLLYFGTLALRGQHNSEVLKKLIEGGEYKEIFVDLNVRLPFCSAESLAFALENATTVKISDEELPYVMRELFECGVCELREAIEKIAHHFPKLRLIIITCGEDGSVAYKTASGEFFSCPATKTEVVSTVGAGDSFCATFAASYLGGASIDECLKKASDVSAFVVSRVEAIPEI